MSLVAVTKPRTFPAVLFASSVGKKIAMAITGFIWFGYVVGHMAGNLQIFAGQNQINAYAEVLHDLGPILWAIRAFLLAAFVIHIWLGIQLKLENMAARPVNYVSKNWVKASLASRTMVWTGSMVLAFFVYHILHFTARVTDPAFANFVDDGQGRYDVYSMVIHSFANIPITAFYLLGVGLLCYHLSHGIASMFQSIGVNSARANRILSQIAVWVAIILFLGYASIPTAVLAGWLKLPGGGM